MLDAMKTCNMKDKYYNTVKDIIGNFTRPSSLTVLQGTTFTIDGVEVSQEISQAVSSCNKLDMSNCGNSIGDAMGKVYYGQSNVTTDATVAQINAVPGILWEAANNAQFSRVNLWEFKKDQLGLKHQAKKKDDALESTERMVTATAAPATTPTKTTATATVTGPPASFDARTQWGTCIQPIRNQGSCGSCWAHAASEVLGDRFCIVSNKTINTVLAPQYEISCDNTSNACNGGYISRVWKFFENTGDVSETCFPYQSANGLVPTCASFKKCLDGKTMRKYYAKVNSTKKFSTPATIQAEIQANGPVETSMDVYKDFMSYKTGIYTYVSGALVGGHAIKIVGWGATNGVNYWIVANSWGTSWGQQGYFQIKFGECSIDSGAYSGIPDLTRQ